MRKVLLVTLALVFAAGCSTGMQITKRYAVKSKKIHVVKRGETLASIARIYGVGVGTIKQANELELDTITVGQRLIIPPRSAATAKSSSKSSSGKGKSKKFTPPKHAPKANVRFIWPIRSPKITSRFGIRGNGKHDGIDIGAKKGTSIVAAASGTVIFSGWGPKGYGLIVIIKHSSDVVTVYAHNSKNVVKKGQEVRQGHVIAKVGNTGRSTGPHLHFEVRVNRIPYNPLKYLPRN